MINKIIKTNFLLFYSQKTLRKGLVCGTRGNFSLICKFLLLFHRNNNKN